MTSAMTYEVTIGERTLEVQVRRADERWFVALDGGDEREVDITRPKPQLMSLIIAGQSYSAGLAATDDGWDVDLLGTHHPCQVVDPRRKALRLSAGTDQGTLSTSMPGKVVRILVSEGDTVSKGDPVAVVEAMKMENELKAPMDGVVAGIEAAVGQAVDAGSVLMRIE
jgi:biotin carboxyl carrier protein